MRFPMVVPTNDISAYPAVEMVECVKLQLANRLAFGQSPTAT